MAIYENIGITLKDNFTTFFGYVFQTSINDITILNEKFSIDNMKTTQKMGKRERSVDDVT